MINTYRWIPNSQNFAFQKVQIWASHLHLAFFFHLPHDGVGHSFSILLMWRGGSSIEKFHSPDPCFLVYHLYKSIPLGNIQCPNTPNHRQLFISMQWKVEIIVKVHANKKLTTCSLVKLSDLAPFRGSFSLSLHSTVTSYEWILSHIGPNNSLESVESQSCTTAWCHLLRLATKGCSFDLLAVLSSHTVLYFQS